MSDVGSSVATILVLDIAFAMVTGMTGIHGLIVDAGAAFGEQVGISPLFGAEAAGHGADVAAGAAETATHGAEMAGECHFHGSEMICH